MASTVALRDASGAPVALGAELGKGGEGAVFDVQGQAGSVAKVYLKPPSRDHADKLAAMVAKADARILNLAAWPTSTLHQQSGATVGFVMPKVAGHRPVFQLYGPKLRLQEFPRADWRFLVAAAGNAARAFSVVHQAGHVIGDVNHGNLFVSQDATVCLIDCDSFQITEGSKRWFCEVGVGTHQPPEMQGLAKYNGVVRTPNHDVFGLAVIVFQLLCMARHPFSGRHTGAGEAPSIEEAIQASRYAYSRDQARIRLAPPPGALPVDALGTTIQAMFELAFSPNVTRGGRPTADQWATALRELGGNLRQCRVNQGHWHLAGLSACPWCDIDAKSGFALFPAVFVGSTTAASGVVMLWQQVTALADPGPLPPVPSPQLVKATASPQAKAVRAKRRQRRLVAAAVAALGLLLIFLTLPPPLRPLPLVAVVVIALVLFYWPANKAARPFRAAADAARRDWRQLEATWSTRPQGASFSEVRTALGKLKQQHDGLPNERARRLRELWEARQQSQLSEHLDRFQIAGAKIGGIGMAKVATLQAHQIFTAGDIDPARIHLTAIPGFGPATKGKLVDWRRECERRFRFDPNRGVSPTDLATLERDIVTKGARIEQDMGKGLAQLRAIVANAELRRRTLEGQSSELLPRLAQANADARVVGA